MRLEIITNSERVVGQLVLFKNCILQNHKRNKMNHIIFYMMPLFSLAHHQ